jgi:membrane dipeptidase
MRPLIDAHLDLALNAIYFNRDLLASVAEVRAAERGMTDELAREKATVTLPELRRAQVPICVATLLARSGPEQKRYSGFRRADIDYVNPVTACAHAQAQLAYYRLMQRGGHLTFLHTREDLARHWERWQGQPTATPLGMILSMEGADPILSVADVEEWWAAGLRAVGLAHHGRGRHAYGTTTDGPLSTSGRELMREFQRIGMIVDVTHLSDRSFFDTMDIYGGPVLASHQNCRALVPGARQFSDEQLRLLIARDAVIGTAFDAWMLYPGWKRGETRPEVVSIEAAADHIDHICQLAGSARHCAIGSDLDGRFGTEQTPRDLDTITDVHALEDILARRGYTTADIDGIFFENWRRFFGESLPTKTDQ